jgi:hypothetical protein
MVLERTSAVHKDTILSQATKQVGTGFWFYHRPNLWTDRTGHSGPLVHCFFMSVGPGEIHWWLIGGYGLMVAIVVLMMVINR